MELEQTFAYNAFRPGQKELALTINSTCMRGGILLAEAMSGFGKTAAVLTGALSAAEETGSRVIYACRTKRQILRVVEEVSRLQRKHPIDAVSMLSKFDYCLLKNGGPRSPPQQSFGWYCWFNVHNNLCSYFLNVGLLGAKFQSAVAEVLRGVPTMSELLSRSQEMHVCPYELVKVAIAQARLAVVPYHYVFDPAASPVLFDRNSIERNRTILVVDEAHNLRDFMRGVNSATVTLEELDGAALEAKGLLMEEAAASLKDFGRVVRGMVESTSGWMLDRGRLLEGFREQKGAAWLQNLSFELSSCSEAAWGAVAYERRLPSLLLKVGEFLVKLSSSESSVLVKWERTLALIEPNPVGGLAGCLGEFRSAVLVSATISPSEVFARSLGLGTSPKTTYRSPVEPAVSVATMLDTGVTTKYKSRSPQMYAEIASRISSIVDATEAGVGIFAPSYAVLEPIFEASIRRISGRNILSEVRGQTSHDSALLMESFRKCPGSVLFGVQGGRFSEGEDFRENLMGAVIVVGLSLPPPSPMLYAEYACLKRAGEPDSYLMLSRLPALRKAFQAAGRHIRSPGKRGLVFLMDRRFDSAVVRDLMPSWMTKDLVSGDLTPEKAGRLTREFWSQGPGKQTLS